MASSCTAGQVTGPIQYTIFDVPILKNLLRGLAILFLKLIGWRKEGDVPDIPQYVIVVAPHTSNWDFPIGLALAFALKLRCYWLGKSSLFRWPFRGFFRWLGGISVERSKPTDLVAQMVQAFKVRGKLALVLTPEGTRKKVTSWKSGFYHIARGARVPIVLAFLDYARKAGGIGSVFNPTGDIEADMKSIQAFYAEMTGKRSSVKRGGVHFPPTA